MPSDRFPFRNLYCLELRSFLLPVLMAGILMPASAQAQVSFTATPPSVNFGSQAIGSASSAQTLTFSIATGTTVGSIGVLTLGAANLDFANAAGSTCTATTYASTGNCTVNVIFKPTAAGLRMGAVVFFSGVNNIGTVLANVPIYGIGSGPQIAYNSGTVTIIDPTVNGEGLSYPEGVAVDGLGDLFIADSYQNRIVEVPASGGSSIAVDPSVNGEELNSPIGVAVDGAGDLFIVDAGHSRVVEMPAGGGTAVAIDPTGLSNPNSIAVDGAGDLFIVDQSLDRAVEVPAGGGAATALDIPVGGSGLWYPEGIAVDGAGDLFIADFGNGNVLEFTAGGGALVGIDPVVGVLDGYNRGLFGPAAVAVDSSGDLFIADAVSHFIVEIQRSQPPAVIFPTPTAVGMSDTTDGAQAVEVQNIGSQDLVFAGVNYPVNFPAAGGSQTSGCFLNTSLSAGQSCNVEIAFEPLDAGTLSEWVTLTDNALNRTAARQLIPVSGTTPGTGPAAMTSPTPSSVLSGSSVVFTWSAGENATAYQLWVSASWIGGHDLYNSGVTTATTETVTLPNNGVTIYVRLVQKINGSWQSADYTYTEAGTPTQAAILSSTPGSVLSGETPFAWSAGNGPTAYQLFLGTTGVGSNDIYNSGLTTAFTKTVNSFPANGVTIYARLWSFINRKWQATDYTYVEAGTPVQATMISPTPGSVLTGTSVPFSWTTGGGPTAYQLLISATWIGGYDLYNSGWTTATNATVTLPANGVTVFVRLSQRINGSWQAIDYTYTEAGTSSQAVLTLPAPGSVLTGASVPFTWTAGSGPTAYILWLGSTGVASRDLYNSGVTAALTKTASNLPTNGATVYARLWSFIDRKWQSTDYTYTAQ